jgi:hypothetical protein
VLAKASLDFVRTLRVVIRHPGGRWELQRQLDIVDARTAEALLERAGFGDQIVEIPTVELFLSKQRLIRQSELVDAVRSRVTRSR